MIPMADTSLVIRPFVTINTENITAGMQTFSFMVIAHIICP